MHPFSFPFSSSFLFLGHISSLFLSCFCVGIKDRDSYTSKGHRKTNKYFLSCVFLHKKFHFIQNCFSGVAEEGGQILQVSSKKGKKRKDE